MKRLALVLGLLAAPAVMADLIYQPVNPNFGGNPLNAQGLMMGANSQNDYTNPDVSRYEPPSAIDRLVSSLESRLLSQLLSDIREGQTGSFSTDNFSIEVIEDGVGGLELNITDIQTGEITRINVSGLIDD